MVPRCLCRPGPGCKGVSPREHRCREKKKLGRSIDEVRLRETPARNLATGNVIWFPGAKTRGDKAIFTLFERRSREFLMIPIADKSMTAVDGHRNEYGEHFSDVFRTITMDNGSEFSDLSDIEKVTSTLVYYAHPYTSSDRASVERHNGIILRFIPRGKRIDSLTAEEIYRVSAA